MRGDMTAAPMRSPLGRAIGLGSAKEGVHHWWTTRLSSIALVPLTIWFVVSVIGLIGGDRATLVAWLHNPVAAVLMILFLATTFYHSALGIQVVLEDYVHGEGSKLGLIIVNRLLHYLLAALTIFAVLKLALGA